MSDITVLRCDGCDKPVLLLSRDQALALERDPARYRFLCLTCSGERDPWPPHDG
jgi:hypothetical protein